MTKGFPVLWRKRQKRGEPAAPFEEGAALKRIAAAAHFLLYLFIFGMPITGALAWYFSFRAMGEVHELAKPVIIVVVGSMRRPRCGSTSM
ncbi:hypothetical protein ACFSQT_34295 [Mesorhizobium calcicola]|uniref:Uncharacterized protein n=1 Tax=Mesorhizobium calcicola TaxID=1300310 RepID=A0ABW4WNK4_9HYPH